MHKASLALAFLILSLFITMENSAQGPADPYEKDWKKVEEFVKKALPQSAVTEVKKIYAQAKTRRQEDQQIKCLIYLSMLQSENREDDVNQNRLEWEKELESKSPAGQAIIHSLLAQLYRDYYQNHRWQIYNRTQTQTAPGKDIGTWTEKQIHDKIIYHFEASLRNETDLQKTRLAPWDAIINKGNARDLRPTLYDLISHRALDYYKSGEASLTSPEQSFEMDLASAFDPAVDFVHRRFATPDSSSLEWKALLLYQKLVSFHLNESDPAALIDVDLDRIIYVRQKSVHPNKDELYLSSINHLAHQYGDSPAAAMAWYYTAEYHRDLGNKYQPLGDTSFRFEKVKAREILKKILDNPLNAKAKDTSLGWYSAYQLLKEIESPSIEFQLESVNIPGLAFRASVSYRNSTRIQLRVLKITKELEQLLNRYMDEEAWAKLEKWPSLRTWQQELPATGDFQQHRVEIKIDALQAGRYILLASTNSTDVKSMQLAGYGQFHVSSISYIKYGPNYFILDRNSGQPLAGAQVQEWKQEYDSRKGEYTQQKGFSYTADRNGQYVEKLTDAETKNGYKSNFFLEIQYKNDRLQLDQQIFSWHPREVTDKSLPAASLFLFTDRSLYRPGQTLFVKGLLVQRDQQNKNPQLIKGRKTLLRLRDANGQEVDSLQVTSNDYGSFQAKFQLPSSGLTGRFSISTGKEQGVAYVQVEEYKRPKFEVSFEPIQGTYQLNDSVSLTGIAKAYAGNNIDGAKVSYRVVRRTRMPYPWWGRSYWPTSEEKEIAHGTVTSNSEGKFTIQFQAIPDAKINKAQNPDFDYEVFADVTDINGETRSGATVVTAAYTAYQLEVTMPARLEADSLHLLQIFSSNRAGQFQKVPVTVQVKQLKPEDRLIRDRFWPEPDQFVMSKAEYIQHFPLDEYANESDMKNWEKGAPLIDQTDSSSANRQWNWKIRNWKPGFYAIEISLKDPSGIDVKEVRYVEIFDPKQKTDNRPVYLQAKASQPIEPGEKTEVQLSSAATDLFVIQTLNRVSVSESEQISFQNWKKGTQSFEFTATEADRGGYGVSWGFVKNNRFHSFTDIVQVPWSNKDLKVEYLSYRDKTLPGSTETWKIRISGPKKDIVAAEVLASMYDASLDQFDFHSWQKPSLYYGYSAKYNWDFRNNFQTIESNAVYFPSFEDITQEHLVYDQLFDINSMNYQSLEAARIQPAHAMSRDVRVLREASYSANPSKVMNYTVSVQNDVNPDVRFEFKSQAGLSADGIVPPPPPISDEKPAPVSSIRKNFNETAFFFPDLYTDAEGNIEFSFTLPEALTRWKFQALAHTKELQLGYSNLEIVTQKELMLQPNPPRFLREGDQIELTAKVVNLTEAELSGQVQLELLNAATLDPLDSRFRVVVPRQYFTAAAAQSAVVSFQVEVPFQFTEAITWRMVAESGKHRDGEQASLPVLSNRLLLTESMPLFINGAGSKTFSFDKLKNAAQSESLQQHRLTVEYSSNPAWYAVQALPYLTEFPYECAEQTWNRYYANALAQHIAGSSPRIRAIFNEWKNADTAALLSNLQKNQELKTVLLEETPWVLEAQSEADQKQRIALLFDMLRMRDALSGTLEKLKNMQNDNGSFAWFKGGPDDRHITQYILTGLGHLQKLGALPEADKNKLQPIVKAGLLYLDQKINNDYQELIRRKLDLSKQQASSIQIQYLYMRSFFPDIALPATSKKAADYYRSRLAGNWTKQNKYIQSMIALLLHRNGDKKTPAAILRSLKETSVFSEEMGRYHKTNTRGWYWYEAPIEKQALIIEAFSEIGNDKKIVDQWRTWLLKNKQTNNWESTKATAEAVYALLLQGSDWLSATPTVTIQLGNKTISSNSSDTEAGTGYFKESISGEAIKPEMGAIRVQVEPGAGQKTTGSSWGAVYWQYFEDMDKVSAAATPLTLKKQLFVQRNSDRGPVLEPIEDGHYIEVGAKVVVRIELKADRDMEYVHMKDLRAASLEPIDVISGYRWNDGAGYYQSTRDVATHFFFDQLRKGTYVFEYSLFANHAGDFSAGVTSIECMYAPEFRAHSNGERLRVQ